MTAEAHSDVTRRFEEAADAQAGRRELDQPDQWADLEPNPFHEDLEQREAETAELDYHASIAKRVSERVYQLRVEQIARERFRAEQAGSTPPFDAGTLSDILKRPSDPPHRVEQLIPSEAGTLVVAQRKTGKTTLQLNLARSLITGQDFLGRFGVRRIDGRVGFLNYEVSAAQIARWAQDARIPEQRLYLVNLRGRRNPLKHPEDQEALAALLRQEEIETLIVDPFGRAYTGQSQNDPGEVGAWLADLDRFARADVGAIDIILAAHAGWNGERTRGSTALEDWADSIITVVRNEQDERFLRAEGRDVSIDEDQLDHDPATRTLTLAGAGSRKTAAKVRQLDALLPVVLDLLRDAPSMSGNQLDTAIKKLKDDGVTDVQHSKGDGARAAQLLERRHMVGSKDGSRGARLFFLLTSPTSLDLPHGKSGDLPDLPYTGEVAKGTDHTDLPSQGSQEQRS